MRHLVVQIVYLGCYVYPNSFVSIHHRRVESVCAAVEAAYHCQEWSDCCA